MGTGSGFSFLTSGSPEDLGAYVDWWVNVSPTIHVEIDELVQEESRVNAGCDMMLAPWPVVADGVGAIEAWDANAAAVGEVRDALVAADRFGSSDIVTIPSFALSGVTFVMSYEDMTIEDWQALALERAGIDPSLWKPELGVDFNHALLPKVYEYYAELYRQNPNFEWAGLAAVVGPGFLGAFEDLGDGSDLARAVAFFAYATGEPLPGGASETISAEVGWYETEFLTMQKNIFMDLAPAHEAYRLGGIAAIEHLAATGQISRQTLLGFRQLDAGERLGDPDMIDQSAATLVVREQLGVIQPNYDRMRDRPFGELVTRVFTFAGRPSVPEGRSYGEVYPLEVKATVASPPDPARPVRAPGRGDAEARDPAARR